MGETGHRPGAEGATAPETLRRKDRRGKGTLESRRARSRLTDEVNRPFPQGILPANLSGSGTEGASGRRRDLVKLVAPRSDGRDRPQRDPAPRTASEPRRQDGGI